MNQLTINIGDRMEANTDFQDAAGDAADPDAVEYKLAEPDGTETTYTIADAEVSNPSVGRWVFSIVITDAMGPGTYGLRVVGSGGVDSAEESEFEVRPSLFSDPT
jgi:hypothetical protein